ncbi:hypothetical protein STEG23_026491, partial [Scotinomys teguina]
STSSLDKSLPPTGPTATQTQPSKTVLPTGDQMSKNMSLFDIHITTVIITATIHSTSHLAIEWSRAYYLMGDVTLML